MNREIPQMAYVRKIGHHTLVAVLADKPANSKIPNSVKSQLRQAAVTFYS